MTKAESRSERILLVEDDADLASMLDDELSADGYTVQHAASAERAFSIVAGFEPALVISDLRLPGMNGMTLLSLLRQQHAPPAFVVITAFGSVPQAVEALKAGADNFLTKPLDMDHLLLVVRRVLEQRRLRREVESCRELLGENSFHGLLGTSRPMRVLFDQIRLVARAAGPVLLLGESGVGKELAARAVHAESERAGGPFLAVNCAGIPADLMESEFFGHAAGAFTGARKARAGLFTEADGGSLLLDEIADMPGALQAKLLRVLENGAVRPVGAEREHRVDVRIIAATNQDLEARTRAGQFRQDLYYRLVTFRLPIPPLRERAGDRELLAAWFLRRYSAAMHVDVRGFDDDAWALIRSYGFPGNVRELQNAVERAVAFANGELIQARHLPARIRESRATDAIAAGPHGMPHGLVNAGELPNLEQLKRRYARLVLDRMEGNKRRAATHLGVGRRTLYRWLEEGDA